VTARAVVLLRVVGFHAWPDAPADVEHLRARHRHLFTLRVECAVRHSERDVEFHRLQRAVKHMLLDYYSRHATLPANAPHDAIQTRPDDEFEFGARSCETIAQEIVERLYDWPITAVEVWEDDECGARVEP